ncbi:MAG: hypothetical protein ACREX8_09080, partial [Gammaproteobacteria bacterium]
SPVTLFGLLAVALALFSGGRARTHTGVLECHGGFARLLLSVTPVHAHAMTLGHVVLGRDAECLEGPARRVLLEREIAKHRFPLIDLMRWRENRSWTCKYTTRRVAGDARTGVAAAIVE